MIIRAGYDIAFDCYQDVPMVVLLSVHPSRQKDLRSEHKIELSPRIIAREGLDPFGNAWTRFVAPPGRIEIRNDFLIEDSGLPDEAAPQARQWDVNDLPDEVLPFLYGSRYCDTQRLTDLAWSLFGPIAGGWQRVQAICDYVHDRIQFGYHHARCDRTASEGHEERVGVCRDFAHSGRHALSLHEHSGPLLHGLSGRYRRAERPCADGFQRLVRGFSRREMVHASMPGTTSPVSGGSSSREGAMRPMLRFRPSLAMQCLPGLMS